MLFLSLIKFSCVEEYFPLHKAYKKLNNLTIIGEVHDEGELFIYSYDIYYINQYLLKKKSNSSRDTWIIYKDRENIPRIVYETKL